MSGAKDRTGSVRRTGLNRWPLPLRNAVRSAPLLACIMVLGPFSVPAAAAVCPAPPVSETGPSNCGTLPHVAPGDVIPDTATILKMIDDPDQRSRGLVLLTKKADRGDVPALVRLATIYLNGELGVAMDKPHAAALFEQAAARDDTVARIQLALLLLDGTSIPSDPGRAVQLLQAASQSGDIWSTTILAGLYTKGDKVPADGAAALRLLQPLVNKNVGAAITAMGDVYAKGPAPVAVNLGRARTLFEQGVALGDIGAKSRLGTILVSGEDPAADVARGLKLLEDVAGAGDGWTLIQIGNLYAAGKVVPLDANKALAYYHRAADGGLAPALALTGNLYNTGLGTIARDPNRAAQFYEQAILARDNTARVQLALMLLDGSSIPRDVARAMSLLEDASKTGDVWSTTLLAGLYTDGKTVPADGNRAITLLQPLVAAKVPAAITALGDVYAKGPAPIKADPARARALFEQSVALRDIGAKSRLGTILTSGQDQTADVARGLGLLEDVAAAGDGWTLIQLGNLYAAGKVVPLDAHKALAYYGRAADGGLAPAFALMGNVYNAGLGVVTEDPVHAAQLYERAVAGKDNTGRVQLALMLLDGTGIPRDVRRAADLLQAASDTKDLWSTTILASLYLDGRFLLPDYARARSYSELARSLGSKDATLQFGVGLAIGPLSAQHLAEGIALVRTAVAANIAGAPLQYGRLLQLGKLNRATSADAISVLQKSIDAGDQAALRSLVQVYRAGVPGIVTPNRAQAQQLLAKYGDLLAPADRAFETILTAAVGPTMSGRMLGVKARFSDLRPGDVTQILRVLRWSYPNEFVYVVQQQLITHDLYRGPNNGILNTATLRGIAKLCSRLGRSDVCSRGPMNSEAVDVLAKWVGSVWSPQAVAQPASAVSHITQN